MAHITALLIALTLTGEPVANALCINWCDSLSDGSVCGEAIANTTAPAVSPVTSACSALLTATPFLAGEGRSAFAAVPTAPANGAAIPSFVTTPFRQLRDHGDATAGRPLPVPVLRV